jgi:asparagine synthase (glutamine-hydrolysing)
MFSSGTLRKKAEYWTERKRTVMCGIAGIVNIDGDIVQKDMLDSMTRVLHHRGPDDMGLYLDRNVGLGHRRLAIVDLSAAGHQPMSYSDGRYWITYNGEVYNFRDIRAELKKKGYVFESQTDTEVILAAYVEWGDQCLQRFNGMWAFAIWDTQQRKLFCCRDRFGIKPFYYSYNDRTLLFASEIKALLVADDTCRDPNYGMIYDYLAYGRVGHSDETFFSRIQELKGGTFLECWPEEKRLRIGRYYDLFSNVVTPRTNGDYEGPFYELFKDSVLLRLMCDVPVGSCLSGGLDSSSIVCMVDKLLREGGVKMSGGDSIQQTFSCRYEDKAHDEGRFIDAVTRQTAVKAHFTYPTGVDLLKDLSDLVYCQEEPFGSTSVYAQWKVFQLMKQSGVKVALDGQGADELLAGYSDYIGPLFADLIKTFRWSDFAREFSAQKNLRGQVPSHDLLIAAGYLSPQTLKNLIRGLRTLVRTLNGIDRKDGLSKEFSAEFSNRYPGKAADVRTKSFMNSELYQGLVFDALPSYLRYEDKNSMAHSIESRLPFLDYRLVQLAFSLPSEMKLFRGRTKRVLRSAMKDILPEEVKSRKDKIGFSTPEDSWLRTDLKEAVLDITNSELFRKRPFFDCDVVKREILAHQAGEKNISRMIWRWVNLELWMRMFIDEPLQQSGRGEKEIDQTEHCFSGTNGPLN